MTKKSLAHPAQLDSTEERREAQEEFDAASRAYYLLADTGCPEEQLERGTDDGSLGEEAAGALVAPEQPYLYPHPLTLARDHAEAERVRLADTTAYASMAATWGRLGGLTTYYRYGPSWFRMLALRRWERISPADLEAARERR